MCGRLRLLIGLALLGLVGGCGDGGVIIYIGQRPPAVKTTSPANGAVNIDPTTTVSAVFDQEMNQATISAATFTLRTAAGPLAGRVDYDTTTRTARFTPDQPLPLLTTCTATLDSAIRSAAGVNLREDYIWSFTTRDGSPGALLTSAATTPLPPVERVVDGGGNVLEVWLEPDAAGRQAVHAARYLAAEGRWSGPPGPLSAPEEDCREVTMAGDDEDNAVIAWVSAGVGWQIVVSRYQAAWDRWLPATVIAREEKRASGLSIEMTAGGEFAISWQVESQPLPVRHLLAFQ